MCALLLVVHLLAFFYGEQRHRPLFHFSTCRTGYVDTVDPLVLLSLFLGTCLHPSHLTIDHGSSYFQLIPRSHLHVQLLSAAVTRGLCQARNRLTPLCKYHARIWGSTPRYQDERDEGPNMFQHANRKTPHSHGHSYCATEQGSSGA